MVSKHTNAQSLIRYTNGCVALPSVTAAKISIVIANDEHLQRIITELPRLYQDFENFCYRGHEGNVLSWDRIQPSYCAFCRREHTNDNTLYAIVVGERVGVGCRHDTTRTIEYVMGAGLKRSVVPKNVKVLRYTSPTPHKYEFPLGIDCLIIQSGMGTQKTTILRQHINAEEYKSIVVVSFRRTFTDETLSRYGGDFKDYRVWPTNKPIRADKLVIQLESLHRLDISEWRPDLLVLDEHARTSSFNLFPAAHGCRLWQAL